MRVINNPLQTWQVKVSHNARVHGGVVQVIGTAVVLRILACRKRRRQVQAGEVWKRATRTEGQWDREGRYLLIRQWEVAGETANIHCL